MHLKRNGNCRRPVEKAGLKNHRTEDAASNAEADTECRGESTVEAKIANKNTGRQKTEQRGSA